MKRPPYPTVTALMSIAEKAYINAGSCADERFARDSACRVGNGRRAIKTIVNAVRKACVESQKVV